MDSMCLWTMIFTEGIVICSEGADRREFGEVEVCCGEKRNETDKRELTTCSNSALLCNQA